jgi:hypothetical protein
MPKVAAWWLLFTLLASNLVHLLQVMPKIYICRIPGCNREFSHQADRRRHEQTTQGLCGSRVAARSLQPGPRAVGQGSLLHPPHHAGDDASPHLLGLLTPTVPAPPFPPNGSQEQRADAMFSCPPLQHGGDQEPVPSPPSNTKLKVSTFMHGLNVCQQHDFLKLMEHMDGRKVGAFMGVMGNNLNYVYCGMLESRWQL